MKNIILFSLIVITFLSCNNNKGKENKIDKDSSTIVKSKQAQTTKTLQDKIVEGLEQMTPVSVDQLKSLMPEKLMNVNLSNYSANSTLGASVATGEYKLNDSAGITLNIYDCAGPGGAGIYNLQFANMLDYTINNENEYTKAIDFNGSKAIEHCMKTNIECSLTYFTGNRFLVTLEGKNVDADALKDLAKGLNIK